MNKYVIYSSFECKHYWYHIKGRFHVCDGSGFYCFKIYLFGGVVIRNELTKKHKIADNYSKDVKC